MTKLAFHPAAAAEFEAALLWYAERSERAAEGFNAAVSQALHEISEAPERWPLYYGKHRVRILAKKFPYHLIYRNDGDQLTVVAVAHHRRKPEYWSQR